MSTARIAWLDRGTFALHTPYDRAFVARLKDAIDWEGRSWNKERRRWEIAAWAYERTLRLCHEHFDEVVADDRPGNIQPVVGGDSPYAVLGLRDDAPREVVEAAYRAMSKKFHPDIVGAGSTERMIAINNAFDAIKESWR